MSYMDHFYGTVCPFSELLNWTVTGHHSFSLRKRAALTFCEMPPFVFHQKQPI